MVKDFFQVMGRAFAIVFGSTFALALVLALCVLAARPLVRPLLQGPQQAPVAESSKPPVPTGYYDADAVKPPVPKSLIRTWDKNGNPFIPSLFSDDCSETGCTFYDAAHHLVGFVPRDEITKAGWIPAGK